MADLVSVQRDEGGRSNVQRRYTIGLEQDMKKTGRRIANGGVVVGGRRKVFNCLVTSFKFLRMPSACTNWDP
jgi:hypothetical protein